MSCGGVHFHHSYRIKYLSHQAQGKDRILLLIRPLSLTKIPSQSRQTRASRHRLPSMVVLSAFLLLASITPCIVAECYLPNGVDRNKAKDAPDHNYQPCKNSTEASMCCNSGTGDICRDNGLCYNPSSKQIWRESCTDPTWKSPGCLKLCADDLLSEWWISDCSTSWSRWGVC